MEGRGSPVLFLSLGVLGKKRVKPIIGMICSGAPVSGCRGFQPAWVPTGTVRSGSRDAGHLVPVGVNRRDQSGVGPTFLYWIAADAPIHVRTEIHLSKPPESGRVRSLNAGDLPQSLKRIRGLDQRSVLETGMQARRWLDLLADPGVEIDQCRP